MRWQHVLLLTCAWLVPGMRAFAECSVRDALCSEETAIDPSLAAAFLQQELGASLPKGLSVLNSTEGGFQDLYIEVEFAGTPDAIATMLGLLAIDPARVTKTVSQDFGISTPPGWSLTNGTPVTEADGVLGSFAVARVAMPLQLDADGTQRLYLLAFKT